MAESRHLIVIAHGSRRAASNEEVMQFTHCMAEVLSGQEAGVEVSCAFLELAEPSIPAAIDAAVESGAKQVDLFPYFLAAGRHVAEDIPGIAAEKEQQYPDVTLRILTHFGAWERLPEMVAAGLESRSR